MKTRIISTLALMAGVLLSGCTREDMPEGGAPGDGNRVVFTLAGITPQQQNGRTRAAGDSGAAKPDASAATDAEKKVTSLLAAAYEKQPSGGMGFYRAFDVTVTDDGCSFDIAKDGRFDLYLVANADPTLEGAVKALGAGSPVTDLEELLVEQAPDADNAFVMTTPEVLKIISYSGEVADCGEVSLRRLSMRIDLLNKAEGLTITKVTFRNRAVKSRLFTPNAMLAEPGAVEDKEYPDLNLVGSFDVPAEYKSKIYGYENLSRRGEATVPTLDIEYTYLDQPYTHTVEFLDRNDPEGLAPLALKRNYLYRITVGRKVEPEFGIEVVDWTNEKSFNVDDITFQAEMNAKLAINHFAGANVKTIDEAQGTVAFTTADPNNTSAYVAWNEKWATAVYYNETDGTYYRVPTKDEMYLLFPDETNHVRFDEAMDGTSEITETLPEKLFGSKETNGGEGKSQIGAVLGTLFGSSMKDGSIGKISENRFARADLEHILLCVDDDMRMEALRQTNYVKSIVTAQGKMDLERKGKQSYQGWMCARLLAFSNGDLQALFDRSDGFYRRQLVLTTKEKPVDRVDDPDLAEKVKAEVEGILLWAFEGLQRLAANNFKFTESDRTRENREAVKRDNNNVYDFLDSDGYVRLKADLSASSKELYEAYQIYCTENNLPALKPRSFSEALIACQSRYNLEYCNNVTNAAGRRVRGFLGIEVLVRNNMSVFSGDSKRTYVPEDIPEEWRR